MKKAVLFDLDNTLYDYDAANKKALIAVHKVLRKEIKISFDEFNKLYKISKEEIKKELQGTASSHNRILYFQRLIEKTHNTVRPTFNLRLYSTYWDTFLKNAKPFPGTIKMLKGLKKRGLLVGIVTDLTTHIQLRKLKKLKLNSCVDSLVTSEEAGSEKPHAMMFLLALNKLDISPHEAIFVGDNAVNDIEGANAVRIDSVLVKHGKLAKLAKEGYKKPDYVIKDISEVLNIVDGFKN